MRKLVWFGATVMVAGAVAVYMAANYAVTHPDSYLGRCAAAAIYVGARSNPVTMATEMARRRGAACAGQVGAAIVCGVLGADGVAEGEQAAEAKPIAPCVPEDQADEREPAEAAEAVEPIKPEVLPQEPVAAPAEDEDGQLVPFTLPVVPMQTEEPMPGTNEAPVASDEDVSPTEVYRYDYEPREVIPMPTEEDATADEEEQYEAEVCPCDGDKPCAAGCCTDGCCCWLKRLMKFVGLVPDMATETTAEECETLAMPAECDDDEPQAEGVEEQDSTAAPSNTAVPHYPTPSSYHHDHGGCPYMGSTCPYYRGTPVVTPVEPAKKVRVKKKLKPVPTKPMSMDKPWKKKVGAGYGEESQEQTGIDTMEFRPSDDPREPPGRSPF